VILISFALIAGEVEISMGSYQTVYFLFHKRLVHVIYSVFYWIGGFVFPSGFEEKYLSFSANNIGNIATGSVCLLPLMFFNT
jgi:hypothetical protein